MPFPPAEYGRLRLLGDRILFGSDFPNIPYGSSDAMRVLTRLPGIADEWLRKVFHDNGARLFWAAQQSIPCGHRPEGGPVHELAQHRETRVTGAAWTSRCMYLRDCRP